MNGETVIFTSRFSKQVNWEVHIVGQNSGAEKILTGFSNVIDADNGGVWDGSTTNLPMIKQEPYMAYVMVDAVDTLFADTLGNMINVNGLRPVDAHIVSDFEGGLNPGFTVFVQSGANMRFDTVNDLKGAEGQTFYEMSGTVDFIFDLGNIMMPKSSWTDTNFTLSENDQNVFFNFFARKDVGIQNEILVWQFMEDENDDGVYDPNTEDLYEYVHTGLATDWEQISIMYSEIVNDTPAGNGIKEPHKLFQIRLIPVSGQQEAFAAYVDLISFTENAPLQP